MKAQSDNPTLYQLGDYYILNPDNSRTPMTNTFNALGAGKITPKTLTATVKNSTITKVYDAMREQTDGNRHVITGDNLVTISGVISGDNVTNVSTAQYASKNVAYAGSTPTTQNVTYTAKFQIANAAEAQNYTFAAQPASTPVVTTKTLTGLGKITPRPVTIGFGTPSKIYDGTATNNNITVNSLNDNLSGAVFNADGITAAGFPTTGITSRYGDGNTTPTFSANANAGNRTVEYAGISNALGGNYSVANKQYGTGTIIRRRIDPSGFKVYKADGTVANATKVYDGNNRHTLAPGAYLTSSPPAPGNTGIVAKDYGKVVKTYADGGIDAVFVRKRSINSDNARRKVDGRVEAKLIEVACSPAPEGHSRWTIRLLEDKMKVLLDEPISREAIRRALKKTDLDLTAATIGASRA